MRTLPENDAWFLQAAFGFDREHAEALALLYGLAVQYNRNLKILVPVLEGIITLEQFGEKGKVIVHTGVDERSQKRHMSVEIRRVVEERIEPIDDKQEDMV